MVEDIMRLRYTDLKMSLKIEDNNKPLNLSSSTTKSNSKAAY